MQQKEIEQQKLAAEERRFAQQKELEQQRLLQQKDMEQQRLAAEERQRAARVAIRQQELALEEKRQIREAQQQQEDKRRQEMEAIIAAKEQAARLEVEMQHREQQLQVEPENPPVAVPQNHKTQSQTPAIHDTTNITPPTPTTTVAAQTQNTHTPTDIITTAQNKNTQDNTVHYSQLIFYEHATAVKQNPTQYRNRDSPELLMGWDTFLPTPPTHTHTTQTNTNILLYQYQANYADMVRHWHKHIQPSQQYTAHSQHSRLLPRKQLHHVRKKGAT